MDRITFALDTNHYYHFYDILDGAVDNFLFTRRKLDTPVMNKLAREFYERDTLIVAKKLLGKYLVRDSPEGKAIGVIVETEAYIGPHDRASHAYNGRRTVRTQIQFGPGGYAYIYQIHGKHFCFCVVTQKLGMPEVVLIRALRPIYGIGLMMKRLPNLFASIADNALLAISIL